MKKIIALSFCLMATESRSFFNFNTEEKSNTIQIKITSTQSSKVISDQDFHKDSQACMELLQNYAKVQKQRKLTFEEMLTIMQVVMFLFLQNSNDYSKKIELILNDGEKLALPYSVQLFAALFEQTSDEDEE